MVSIDPSLQLKKIQLTPEEAAQNDGQRRASDATMGDNDSLFNNREVQASLGNKKASADNIFAAEDSNPFIKAGNPESTSSSTKQSALNEGSSTLSQAKRATSSSEGLRQNAKQIDDENSISLKELDSLISSVNGRQESAHEMNASLQTVLDTNITQIKQLSQTAASEQEKAEKAKSDEKQANQKISQYQKELAQLDKKDSIDDAKKFSTFSLKTAAENDEDEKAGKTQPTANKTNTNAKKAELKAKIALETNNANKAKAEGTQATQAAQTAQTQAQQQTQDANSKADSASNFIKASNAQAEAEKALAEGMEEARQESLAEVEKIAAGGATISSIGQVTTVGGKKLIEIGSGMMASPYTATIGKAMLNVGGAMVKAGPIAQVAGKVVEADANSLAAKLDSTGEKSKAFGESLGGLATTIGETIGLKKQVKDILKESFDDLGVTKTETNEAGEVSKTRVSFDKTEENGLSSIVNVKTYKEAITQIKNDDSLDFSEDAKKRRVFDF